MLGHFYFYQVFTSIVSGSMLVGQTASYFEAFATARGAAGKIFDVIKRVIKLSIEF